MKKLFVLLMAFGLFIACNNNKKPADNLNAPNREKDDYRTNTEKTNTPENNNDNKDNSGGWTAAEEAKWMQACNDPSVVEKLGQEKTNTYCSCMLDKLKERYQSFAELDAKGTTEEGKEIGKICLKEMGLQTNE